MTDDQKAGRLLSRSAFVVADRTVGIERMARRPAFLAAQRTGVRWSTPSLVLQWGPGQPDRVRIGFTVTKKVGNAVVRNRVKRRLRAVARDVMPACAVPGNDYVLIGRSGGLTRPYALMKADLEQAMAKVSAKIRTRGVA